MFWTALQTRVLYTLKFITPELSNDAATYEQLEDEMTALVKLMKEFGAFTFVRQTPLIVSAGDFADGFYTKFKSRLGACSVWRTRKAWH